MDFGVTFNLKHALPFYTKLSKVTNDFISFFELNGFPVISRTPCFCQPLSYRMSVLVGEEDKEGSWKVGVSVIAVII